MLTVGRLGAITVLVRVTVDLLGAEPTQVTNDELCTVL